MLFPADWMSLFGVKWSGTITTLLRSKTLRPPAFLNSAMAMGAVTSCPIAISTCALISMPG